MYQGKIRLAVVILLVLAFFGIGQGVSAVATPHLSSKIDTLNQKAEINNGGATFGDFGACLAAEKKGQIVLLLDQSGSLRTSDPEKDRAKIADFFLTQLASYADKTKGDLSIQVAGFSYDYFPNEWTKLTASNLDQLKGYVKNITDNLSLYDTDYPTALMKARVSLANHRGDVARKCQAIAWFTDGNYDIDPRTSANQAGGNKSYAPNIALTSKNNAEKVKGIGQQAMCRDGGIADQLRGQGVTLIGLGLNKTKNVDLSLLDSVVTGKSCGKLTVPPGVMFTATNSDELLLAFDKILQPGTQPLQTTKPTCADTLCKQGTYVFTLDHTLSQVKILTATKVKAAVPYLVTPSGKKIKITKGISNYKQLTGTASVFTFNPQTFDEWVGVWKVAMVAPKNNIKGANSSFSIMIDPGIEVFWSKQKNKLRAGEVMKDLLFTVKNKVNNKPIDAKDIEGEVSIDAEAIDNAGHKITLGKNIKKSMINKPLKGDFTKAVPGPMEIKLKLSYTSAPAKDHDGKQYPGTKMMPVESNYQTELFPSADFPVLGRQVNFGTIEEAKTVNANLGVTGPGCVWLKDIRVSSAPDKQSNLKIHSKYNSAENCLSVKKGTKVELPISLKVKTIANGAFTGKLLVATTPLDEKTRIVEVPVQFEANLLKPVDKKTAIISTVLATLLGLIIPLLLLYLSKWYTTKIPKKVYRLAEISVPLKKNMKLELPDEGKMPIIRGGGRDFNGGILSLRAKMSLSPLAPSYVVATNPRGIIIGSHPSRKAKDRALLPLDIASSWVIYQQNSSTQEATIWLILDGSPTAQAAVARQATLQSAEAGLNEFIDEFSVQEDASPSGNDQFGFSQDTVSESMPGSPFGTSNSLGLPDTQSQNPFGGQPQNPFGGQPQNPFGTPNLPPSNGQPENPFGGQPRFSSRPDDNPFA